MIFQTSSSWHYKPNEEDIPAYYVYDFRRSALILLLIILDRPWYFFIQGDKYKLKVRFCLSSLWICLWIRPDLVHAIAAVSYSEDEGQSRGYLLHINHLLLTSFSLFMINKEGILIEEICWRIPEGLVCMFSISRPFKQWSRNGFVTWRMYPQHGLKRHDHQAEGMDTNYSLFY